MAKANKYRSEGVPAERVAELRARLEAGEIESASDADVGALASHLAEAAAVDALVALAQIAEGKAQRKAVNQALYRLKQRGVAVPDLGERPKGIRLAVEDEDEELPGLLYTPMAEGTRFMLLPLSVGRSLYMLRARLREPLGLEVLEGGELARRRYRTSIKVLQEASIEEGRVILVPTGADFTRRKIWEIGRAVRSGRTGGEVDAALCAELRWSEEAPPHPVELLALDEEPYTIGELGERPQLLVPLFDSPTWNRVHERLSEAKRSPLLLSSQTADERYHDISRDEVARWLQPWDDVGLGETFLDTALFHGLAGELRAARTFRDLVSDGDHAATRERVVSFVGAFVADFFAEAQAEEPPPETSSGGIIIP